MLTRSRIAAMIAVVATAASALAAEPSPFPQPADPTVLEAVRSIEYFMRNQNGSSFAVNPDQAAVVGAIRGGDDFLFAVLQNRPNLLADWPSRANITDLTTRRDAWARLAPALVTAGRCAAREPAVRAALRSIAENQGKLADRDFEKSVRGHHGLFLVFAALAPEEEELRQFAEESQARLDMLRQKAAAAKAQGTAADILRSDASSSRGMAAPPAPAPSWTRLARLKGKSLEDLHHSLDQDRLQAAVPITRFLQVEGDKLHRDAQKPEEKAVIASMRLSDDFLVCVLPGMDRTAWNAWRSDREMTAKHRTWKSFFPLLIAAGREAAADPVLGAILKSVYEGLTPHDASSNARARRSLLAAFAALAPEDGELNAWVARVHAEHARSRADASGKTRPKPEPPPSAEERRDERRTRTVSDRLRRLAEVAKGQEAAAVKTEQFVQALERLVEDILAEPSAATKGPALQHIARLQQLRTLLEALEAANSSRIREWKTRVGAALGAAYSALSSTPRAPSPKSR